MERKFKVDILTFKFDEIQAIISSLHKDICFLYKSQFYKIISNPFFDLDNKEVTLQVEYEDYSSYFHG